MLALGTKKLLIIIAIVAIGFLGITDQVYVQAQGFDEVSEGIDDVTQAQGGQLSQAGVVNAEGRDGEPSAGARLGFTGWNETIFNVLSALGGFFAWIGGFMLDAAIGFFTVGMVDTAELFNLTDIIEDLWGVVRDLFNLLFIFGLIWAGFKLILGDDSSKRMIGGIVVAALLINFSLYAAQIVVDFTNVIAYQIHSLITPAGETTIMGTRYGSISSNFTYLTGLDRLNEESMGMAERAGLEIDTIGSAIVLGLIFTIFYGLLGFVFAAGAFILFSRFLTLLILLIFSPVFFVGWILPNMAKYSSQWQQLFLKQAMVGPTFLFMLYISLQALNGLDSIADEDYTVYSVIIYLVIVVGFLLASVKVARSMSDWGAYQAYNVGEMGINKARRVMGASTSGLAARGLRWQVGKRAQKYAESDLAKDRAANSWFGRRALNISRKLGDASFDARGIGGVGKKLGLGESIKGYASRTKEIEEQEKKYADSLGKVSDDDPRVQQLQLELDAAEQSLKKKKADIRQKQKDKADPLLTETQRQGIQAQIDGLKTDVEEQEEKLGQRKEALSREQHRRQLGSVASIPSKVMEADKAISKLKNEISDATNKHSTTTDPALKATYAAEIKAKKKDLANAQARRRNNLKKATVPEKLASEIEVLKNEIKADLIGYENEKGEAAKKKRAEEISEKRKILDEKENEANKLAKGYATTVENSGTIKNFFTGRNAEQNMDAAKEIRKEFKKKIKSKDESK